MRMSVKISCFCVIILKKDVTVKIQNLPHIIAINVISVLKGKKKIEIIPSTAV